MQNRLAHVVCNVGKRDQNTINLLRGLHCLPVYSWITFKMATLCFKAHQHGQPGYLNTVLQPHVLVSTLRSSHQVLLVVLVSKTKTAARHFSIAAPTVWNTLYHVRFVKPTVFEPSCCNEKHTFSRNILTNWGTPPHYWFVIEQFIDQYYEVWCWSLIN